MTSKGPWQPAAAGEAELVALCFRGRLAAPRERSAAIPCSLSAPRGPRELLPTAVLVAQLSVGSRCCLSPQVLLEALYFSLVAKRLHPEEDDTLVEHPFVEHVSEKISKVRPPQGFALFQAKEEARKVKLLHRMLKVRRLLMPECWLRELRYVLVWVLPIQL